MVKDFLFNEKGIMNSSLAQEAKRVEADKDSSTLVEDDGDPNGNEAEQRWRRGKTDHTER